MKKYIISVVVAVTLIVAGGYGVKTSMNPRSHLSDLTKANVEALAGYEIEFPFLCWVVPAICIIEYDENGWAETWFGRNMFE